MSLPLPLPLIDVHTHMYLPRYVALLRQRTQIPRIVSRGKGDRLIILPDEEADGSTSAGRPIGGEFHEVARKLAFMDHHGIAVSVVSWPIPGSISSSPPRRRRWPRSSTTISRRSAPPPPAGCWASACWRCSGRKPAPPN